MTTKTRLAERVASDVVEQCGFLTGKFYDGLRYDVCDPRCAPAEDPDMVCQMDANAALILEAFRAAQETGLSPAEMQELLHKSFGPEDKALAVVACRKALSLIKDTWIEDHGNQQVGEAWGALDRFLDRVKHLEPRKINLQTLFGPLHIELSAPNADGQRGGCIESGLQRDPDHLADDALDALEALILAHACAGMDVKSEAYLSGVNTALETIDNNT